MSTLTLEELLKELPDGTAITITKSNLEANSQSRYEAEIFPFLYIKGDEIWGAAEAFAVTSFPSQLAYLLAASDHHHNAEDEYPLLEARRERIQQVKNRLYIAHVQDAGIFEGIRHAVTAQRVRHEDGVDPTYRVGVDPAAPDSPDQTGFMITIGVGDTQSYRQATPEEAAAYKKIFDNLKINRVDPNSVSIQGDLVAVRGSHEEVTRIAEILKAAERPNAAWRQRMSDEATKAMTDPEEGANIEIDHDPINPNRRRLVNRGFTIDHLNEMTDQDIQEALDFKWSPAYAMQRIYRRRLLVDLKYPISVVDEMQPEQIAEAAINKHPYAYYAGRAPGLHISLDPETTKEFRNSLADIDKKLADIKNPYAVTIKHDDLLIIGIDLRTADTCRVKHWRKGKWTVIKIKREDL